MQLRNQKGFTLIEIAIVLTIVGLVIGGIWLAASTVFTNNKAQRLSANVVQVIQNTKTLFSGQGAGAVTTGFNTQAIAARAGIFPAEMVAGNAAAPIIITPFSTDPTVQAVTVAAPSATTVQYTFGTATQGLPSSACTSLLTTLGSAQNIQKLGITALAGNGPITMPAAGVSVTAAAASAQCANAGNTNVVSVTFSAI